MSNYDRQRIHAFLDGIRTEIGDAQFSGMRLLELERLLRKRDVAKELPGKTVLRSTINSYRTAKWPDITPKRLAARFRF